MDDRKRKSSLKSSQKTHIFRQTFNLSD